LNYCLSIHSGVYLCVDKLARFFSYQFFARYIMKFVIAIKFCMRNFFIGIVLHESVSWKPLVKKYLLELWRWTIPWFSLLFYHSNYAVVRSSLGQSKWSLLGPNYCLKSHILINFPKKYRSSSKTGVAHPHPWYSLLNFISIIHLSFYECVLDFLPKC
jgi:hypothetical protein